jgi:hypothetical protein
MEAVPLPPFGLIIVVVIVVVVVLAAFGRR